MGPLLQSIDVISDVVAVIRDGLAANGLTLDRVWRDLEAAWDEIHLADGTDAAIAIIARYVRAFLADVQAFVSSIVDAVMAKVRAVVADVAEPIVRRPPRSPRTGTWP